MKKTLLVVTILLFSLPLFFCGPNADVEAQKLVKEYETMQTALQNEMKAVDSSEAYMKFKETKTQKLEAFLLKVAAAGDHDDVVLLHGKTLFQLKKTEEALQKFDALIQKKSPKSDDATFAKVMILQGDQKFEDALKLFKEVETKVEKNDDYYGVISEFAFYAQSEEDRKAYSKQFLAGVQPDMNVFQYKGYHYENLANIEKEHGNMDMAVKVLEDGIAAEKDEKTKKSLDKALGRLKMINGAAPELEAEVWLNSDPLTMASLKGKVVLVDFWAPWCPPCRAVIPTLIESYDALKDKGLMVIGFTKIYGRYRDDKVNHGEVSKEDEQKYIAEYVKTRNITYPVAIAETGTIFDAYSVSGIPQLVFIDKEGKVHEIEVGAGDMEVLKKKIEKLLE